MSGRTTLRHGWAASLAVLTAVTMAAAPLASADPTAGPADQDPAPSSSAPNGPAGTAEDVSGRAGEAPAGGSEPLENIETAQAVVTATNSAGQVTSTTVENPSDEITVSGRAGGAPGGGVESGAATGPSASAPADRAPSSAPSSDATAGRTPAPSSGAPSAPATGAPTAADGTTVLEDIRTDDAGSFSMVGVTWTALSGEALGVHVRTLTASGWSEWYDVTPDEEESEQRATGVIYVEDSTAVEVQATSRPGGTAEGMRAVLIDSPARGSDPTNGTAAAAMSGPTTAARPLAANGSVPQPTMITRSQWGAIAQDGCEANSDTIRAVAVHHTAGSNDYSAGQSASIVRGIQYYHEVTLGWCDIGYNFLVDKYGQVFEGKGGGATFPVHGAHATTWNWETVGISLMMNSNTAQPSGPMLTSLEDVIAWKIANNYLDPLGTVSLGGRTINVIFRHGDVMSTECPGTNVTNRMAEIRNAVAARVSGKTYSTIYDTWRAAGGESGGYGVVYEMEHSVRGGRQTNFAHGSVFASPDGVVHTVRGGIGNEYVSLGYEHGYLGRPTSGEVCGLRNGGCYQNFENGSINWTPTTGAHALHGAIRDEWGRTGWEAGFLGYPTSGEVCGLRNGGCYQNFENGSINWTPTTGAHALHGAIRDEWGRTGWEAGFLGYPTSGEVCGLRNGGCYQNFENGSINWTPTTGAHALHGAIRDEWGRTGWENGPLGYPTSGEVCGLRNGGCHQDFQNGQVHWSPGSGAHATRGAIRDEWRATGWENGPLGYPTTGEVCGLRNGGCYQTYQGGSVHWTSATGAHATHGAIGERWASQNWEQGPLGYPTSDEIATGTGSYQMFEGGAIIWTANGSRTEAITMNSSGLTPTQQDYLRQALPAAVAESQQYGVPVSVALGQSILESGWGGSTLSSRYNNYFGIKCSTSSPYQGGCINMGSGEYLHSSYQIISSSFRTYGSRTDSFLDHGYFLTHNSRYGGAFAHTGDPDRFIREVARAGYATDPNYAQKVINLMNAYDLYQYDI